jgi:cell division protein FtsQ
MLADAWDRPRLLDGIASLLYAVSTLLGLYLVFMLVIHLPVFPLREVHVHGELRHVTRAQVESLVRGQIHGNLFTADLDAVRRGFGTLPWVRRVEVRRVWPDRLEVSVEEHVALARWGGLGLVNTHGEVFAADSDARLPLFVGPAGTSREIAERYLAFRAQLAPLGLEPAQVTMTARRAWELRLADGLRVRLGREHIETRLATLIDVYGHTVGPVAARLDYVDLRYPNGFAVRINQGRPREGAS